MNICIVRKDRKSLTLPPPPFSIPFWKNHSGKMMEKWIYIHTKCYFIGNIHTQPSNRWKVRQQHHSGSLTSCVNLSLKHLLKLSPFAIMTGELIFSFKSLKNKTCNSLSHITIQSHHLKPTHELASAHQYTEK